MGFSKNSGESEKKNVGEQIEALYDTNRIFEEIDQRKASKRLSLFETTGQS